MNLTVVTDVVIGLAALYWLLSSGASLLLEGLHSFFNLRARALQFFVVELVYGSNAVAALLNRWKPLPKGAAQVAAQDQLSVLSHPLLLALNKPVAWIGSGSTSPSYIPGDLFAKVLVDRLLALVPGAPADVATVRVALALPAVPAHLALALRPLIDAANHDLEALYKGIQNWFDQTMDRATGWFKRWSALWLSVIALVVAIVFNVDSLYIARRLASDDATRAAGVALGQRVAASAPGQQAELVQKLIFAKTFDSPQWQRRLSDAKEPADASDGARLALTLLVRAGALQGPMLALQERALVTPDGLAAAAQPELDAVAAALCRARLERSSDHFAELLKLPAAKLLADKDCKAEADQAKPSEGQTLAQTMDRLWTDPTIVWRPSLAQAAWAVLRATRSADVDHQKLATFVTEMAGALAEARQASAPAEALLARLPEVGSVGNAWRAWQTAGTQPGGYGAAAAVGMSLFGWLITALMAGLGAPFWYDLIGRLTSRRLTGPKPDGDGNV